MDNKKSIGRFKRDPRSKFFSADELLQQAQEYFDYCDQNPLYEYHLVYNKGVKENMGRKLSRPYTVDGFMCYLGVSGGYFRAAKANCKNKIKNNKASQEEMDILEAIDYIEQRIRSQQIEGAAVGIFSTNLVARLNGLVDKRFDDESNGLVLNVTVRDKKTVDNMNKLDEIL